jgi:hypothetical protein
MNGLLAVQVHVVGIGTEHHLKDSQLHVLLLQSIVLFEHVLEQLCVETALAGREVLSFGRDDPFQGSFSHTQEEWPLGRRKNTDVINRLALVNILVV